MKIFQSAAPIAGLWGLFLLLNNSFSTGEKAIAAAPVRQQCQLVEQSASISRSQLSRLYHIAPGNSTSAMRSLLGLPYCFVGSVEYFPANFDDSGTWIAVRYNRRGRYVGYDFSFNN
ncbi:MAG: hypothetical protein HC878_03555 [Leptolyngbyaceae cyanobacterium SL_5_14]|nr:hypothetical protein [Leptolyngbyaceae cyanobacterium SL_5_14]NJO66161.1 hypothetical protein [Leptolyngbyaceae cyanobacterium RM1_405_57]